MGKVMISLSDDLEDKMRKEVEEKFMGRVGGLSIFFEQLVRAYFNGSIPHQDSLEKPKSKIVWRKTKGNES